MRSRGNNIWYVLCVFGSVAPKLDRERYWIFGGISSKFFVDFYLFSDQRDVRLEDTCQILNKQNNPGETPRIYTHSKSYLQTISKLFNYSILRKFYKKSFKERTINRILDVAHGLSFGVKNMRIFMQKFAVFSVISLQNIVGNISYTRLLILN